MDIVYFHDVYKEGKCCLSKKLIRYKHGIEISNFTAITHSGLRRDNNTQGDYMDMKKTRGYYGKEALDILVKLIIQWKLLEYPIIDTKTPIKGEKKKHPMLNFLVRVKA